MPTKCEDYCRRGQLAAETVTVTPVIGAAVRCVLTLLLHTSATLLHGLHQLANCRAQQAQMLEEE